MFKYIALFLFLIATLSAEYGYSITFGSYKYENNARGSYAKLKEIFKKEMQLEQLNVRKYGKYWVVSINQVKESEEKKRVVSLSKKYFPDLVVRREKLVKSTLKKRALKEEPRVVAEKSKEITVDKKPENQKVMSVFYDTAKRFSQAVELYNQKSYDSSYELLSELKKEGHDSDQSLFYHGRSAFEIGKYNEALDSFEALLKRDENFERVRLERARTLYALKKYKESKVAFEDILNRPVPEGVKANARKFIEKIKKATKSSFFSGALIVGIGHDDNVKNGNDVLLRDHFNTLDDSVINPKESASFHQEIFLLSHKYRPKSTPNQSWQSRFVAYNKGYRDFSSERVSLAGLTSGPVFTQERVKYSLPVTFQKIWVGSENYAKQYDVTPQIDYVFSRDMLLNAALKWQLKRYEQDRDIGRNSKYRELSIGAVRVIDGVDFLTLRGVYGADRKSGGNFSDVNKDARGFSAIYAKKLPDEHRVTLSYDYTKNEYLNKDAVTSLERIEKKSRYAIKLAKNFSDKLQGDISYSYIDNSSTVRLYAYTKTTFLASVLFLF